MPVISGEDNVVEAHGPQRPAAVISLCRRHILKRSIELIAPEARQTTLKRWEVLSRRLTKRADITGESVECGRRLLSGSVGGQEEKLRRIGHQERVSPKRTVIGSPLR
ncbi:MAG: hypothetical protein KatS3mg112_0904 [Thermogutta sp.]|nr:MAG: hypothetical protein KatS3mg112_0904 [Thermogutta sp.]